MLFSYMIAKVMDMDEVLKQSLLFDFYGELLTEHQRNVYRCLRRMRQRSKDTFPAFR